MTTPPASRRKAKKDHRSWVTEMVISQWDRTALYMLRLERNPHRPRRAKAWRVTATRFVGGRADGRQQSTSEHPLLADALRAMARGAKQYAPKGGW